MLTYASLTEGKTFEQISDFDAYLEGRELPSQIRKREAREAEGREFLQMAPNVGGEVG